MMRTAGVAMTVFGCGWVLMGLEILGGRMLSPDFGSGVWVWGSVISVFLAALSIGYFLGGMLSQRSPHGEGLGYVILASALSLVPVALWHRSVSASIAELGLDESWGSLLGAAALFFVPSVMLGMVSPYAVRLVTRSVATAGSSAGRLYAISTVGSFLGCLLTSFYFILWLSIQQVLLLSVGALLVVAIWQVMVWRIGTTAEEKAQPLRRFLMCWLISVAVATAAAWFAAMEKRSQADAQPVRAPARNGQPDAPLRNAGTQPAANRIAVHAELPEDQPAWSETDGSGAARVLYEKESLYHYVRVVQEGSLRRLQFRRSGSDYEESVIDLLRPLEFQLSYYELMFAGLAHQPNPKTVLIIGLGGGTIPLALHHYYPKAQIDNVELDEEVVKVARDYFGFPEDGRMKVYVRDGRVQVRQFVRDGKQYDLILLDAFRGGYIPYHLTTKEFLEDIKRLLTKEGVVVSNLQPGFESYHYHRRTLGAAFRHQCSYGSYGNVIVVTDMLQEQVDQEALVLTAERLQQQKRFTFYLPEIVRRGGPREDYQLEGPILTDDYAPTDVLRSMPRE